MNAVEKKSAKKAANIKAYGERVAKLQHRQNLAKFCREKHGYVGNDDQVIAMNDERLRTIAVQRNRLEINALRDAEIAKAVATQNYIDESLAGPSGKLLKGWLANRLPTVERVERFFNERPTLERVAAVKQAA